jgi:NAD(P)-dependent dehydrogenase (short-subunit alcohol dehydrogenase family)
MNRIIMTGATKGIGHVAATHLVVTPDTRLIVGARGDGAPAGCETLPLDLTSLDSVRGFAKALGDEPIDILVMNAGIQFNDVGGRSTDGFENTFATNHLAHYLLARLLLPHVSAGGRIILTSSGTHDPALKTGVPAPRHADAAKLANPDLDPDKDRSAIAAGLRAYASSKLCNLLTARSIAALPDVQARSIAVHAYDPGLTPETGLARNAPWPVRTFVWPLLPLFVPFSKSMNSLANAGKALADLSTGTVSGDRLYMSLRRAKPEWPDASILAQDDAVAAKLWADSAAMVGLPG